MVGEEKKLSPVEGFKQTSNFLAGEIGGELTDGTDKFGKGSVQLLKHHGTYQQDNRDQRGGGQKSYIFMVRTKLPLGELTSQQLLAELDRALHRTPGALEPLVPLEQQVVGAVIADAIDEDLDAVDELGHGDAVSLLIGRSGPRSSTDLPDS